MPLFGELSRSSRDSFESESDSKESRDDWLNSPKSGNLHFFDFVVRRRHTGGRRRTTKSKKCKLPFFGELSRSSWDSFELDSDSKESRDDRLNSLKSGVFDFLRFWGGNLGKNSIRSVRYPFRFDRYCVCGWWWTALHLV